MAISKIDSQIISQLRFPLAILVVFCHLNPTTTSLADADFNLLSTQGVANTIEIVFSYVLGHTAVPGFFLISGFLYFIGLEKWNWGHYWTKTYKRIHSLLIPYLAWNLLSILSFLLLYIYIGIRGSNFQDVQTYLSSIDLSSFWNCKVWGLQKTDWLGNLTPSSGPIVVTLWFLRDLISVSAITPIFYILFKTTKFWGLSLLFLCYLTKIWIHIPGFSIDACFYFGAGAFLAINDHSLAVETKKYKWLLYAVALLSFPCCTFYGGLKEHIGSLIFPVWAIAFVGTYVNWARIANERNLTRIPPKLIRSCMFIYAFHALPIAKFGSLLSWLGYKISILFSSVAGHELITYFVTPIVTIGFCILLFFTVEYISPTASKILTGKAPKK